MINYKTEYGTFYQGKVETLLKNADFNFLKNKINLIFTSPPFPLNRKKKYGNLIGEEYSEWFSSLAPLFREYLSEDGSIVVEMGNSWEHGKPIMSTLALRSLLSFLDQGNFSLCQQFVWYNTAKLPSPAQWVNIERIRVKDSFTHIWWMSKTPYPKANNKNVLVEYSQSMKNLLKSKKYNSGKRPSDHVIGSTSFIKNNDGAIPCNVLVSANTKSNSRYLNYCRQKNLILHPARMPIEIPNFFIKLLTSTNDLVIDPFAGSNTTGQSSEELKRKWIAFEANIEYIEGSKGRFEKIEENEKN